MRLGLWLRSLSGSAFKASFIVQSQPAECGFDPGFQVLERGFHAGVSVLAFVDGAALVVGADKGGNYVILPNFNPACFLDKAVNRWILGFKYLIFTIMVYLASGRYIGFPLKLCQMWLLRNQHLLGKEPL
jgi:hypothetical protein